MSARGGSGGSLARELAIVLIVKLVALAALWFAFFRPGATPPAPEPDRIVAPSLADPPLPKEPSP